MTNTKEKKMSLTFQHPKKKDVTVLINKKKKKAFLDDSMSESEQRRFIFTGGKGEE